MVRDKKLREATEMGEGIALLVLMLLVLPLLAGAMVDEIVGAFLDLILYSFLFTALIWSVYTTATSKKK